MWHKHIRHACITSVLISLSGCAEHVQLKNFSIELADVREEIRTDLGYSERVTPDRYLAFEFSLDRTLEHFANDRYMLGLECNVIAKQTAVGGARSQGPFTFINNDKVLPDSLQGPRFIVFGFQNLNIYSEDRYIPTPLKELPFDRIDCQLTHRVMMLGWRMESDVVSFSREEVLRVMAQTPQIISAQQ